MWRGTLVLIAFFLLFKTRFSNEFVVSGLGMVFKVQSVQLALGFVFEQPFTRGML